MNKFQKCGRFLVENIGSFAGRLDAPWQRDEVKVVLL